MLKNEEIIPRHPCIQLPFVFIARSKDLGNGNTSTIMTDINDDDLHNLENGETITITRGENVFIFDVNKCFCYGEFDFSPNSEDIKNIINHNIFDKVNIRHFIPSKYDFNTHTVQSNIRRGEWFDTDNIETYLPFLWGCLNKPKQLVIFKYSNTVTTNVSRSKRNVNKKSDVEEKPKYKHKYREEKKQIKMNSITFKFN